MGLHLKVRGVTLKYNTLPILDGIDFTLQGSEMVALLGPNGAGKSTLLRCISRALEPTAGAVYLNGSETSKMKPGEIARQLAVVPQDTGVDFDFTVEEVVQMGRFPYHKGVRKSQARDEDIVHSAMEITEILHLRHRSAATLSGGETQRMVFARALCQEPDLLLLDEPTANLDIGYQWELLDIVSKLNREKGVTIIAAIHDLNLAALFFKQFVLLTGGKVLAFGSSEEVLTEKNIHTSYGIPASIFRHPLHGRLQVSVGKESVTKIHRKESEKKERVHVLGGGKEALPVLETLFEQGYSLSLGPVSKEDSGYQFADFFNIPVIENPPFSPVNDSIYQQHLAQMFESVCVVLPPISFGEGNLRNLEAMVEAVDKGIPGMVVGNDFTGRDFTGGKALDCIKRLQKKGAIFLRNAKEVAARIKGCGEDSQVG